jgi:hypothetical protein
MVPRSIFQVYKITLRLSSLSLGGVSRTAYSSPSLPSSTDVAGKGLAPLARCRCRTSLARMIAAALFLSLSLSAAASSSRSQPAPPTFRSRSKFYWLGLACGSAGSTPSYLWSRVGLVAEALRRACLHRRRGSRRRLIPRLYEDEMGEGRGQTKCRTGARCPRPRPCACTRAPPLPFPDLPRPSSSPSPVFAVAPQPSMPQQPTPLPDHLRFAAPSRSTCCSPDPIHACIKCTQRSKDLNTSTNCPRSPVSPSSLAHLPHGHMGVVGDV